MTVMVDAELYAAVVDAARLSGRTVDDQLDHWVRIGREYENMLRHVRERSA